MAAGQRVRKILLKLCWPKEASIQSGGQKGPKVSRCDDVTEASRTQIAVFWVIMSPVLNFTKCRSLKYIMALAIFQPGQGSMLCLKL